MQDGLTIFIGNEYTFREIMGYIGKLEGTGPKTILRILENNIFYVLSDARIIVELPERSLITWYLRRKHKILNRCIKYIQSSNEDKGGTE